MRNLQLERVSTIWFLTLGLTSLAAAILVYILLLESALGAFKIQDASPMKIGEDTRPRVALLNSNYTKNAHRALSYRDTSTAWVDQTLLSWREFLIKQSPAIPFEDIRDDQLENGELDDFEVLILPSSRALSDLQIRQIQEFMQRGGSVLATWTSGVYREDGTWRGWNFIEDTFGVKFEGFVERGNWNFRIYSDTFPGYTPPGIYLPKYVTESKNFIPPTSTDAAANDARYKRQQQESAKDADFAPLRDYSWFDSLNTARPTVDFARANPIVANMRDLDGVVREQDAVVVSYFTYTGFDQDREIPYPRTSNGIRRLTLRSNTPLTADIPSGYRVKIQVYNPGVKVSIAEPERATAAGFWYDFATDNIVGADNPYNTTGLVHGTYGEGRFVYMGFQRDAMGVGPCVGNSGDREDCEAMQYFFRNTMNYLRRTPTIWVHDWPFAKDGATMITGATNTERGIAAFAPIADILEAEKAPGTYFVAPEQGSRYSSLLQRLHRQGDVAVYDSLRVEADGLPQNQVARLRRLRVMLEGLVNGRVQGYRSTERGLVGINTMGGLVQADYTYFLPDSIGRRITPKIMGDEYSPLTRIGTTQHSDHDIVKGLQGSSSDLMNSLLHESLERVHYEGGLYNLVYDPELLGSPANIGTLKSLVQDAKSKNMWIASGDSIAHWWRLKRAINSAVEQRSPSRIFVRISNDNGSTAKEVTVSIALGRSVAAVNVRPELINIFKPVPDDVDIPPYVLRENGTVLELSIRELKPQQYRIYHIDLLGPEMASNAGSRK
ncbi:hypothetical protein HQ496_02640 [bacterium]|nr:hypothetical protein [bacterium]